VRQRMRAFLPLDPAGSALAFVTYFGGNSDPASNLQTDAGAIGLDHSGNVWVAGITSSPGFPAPSDRGGAYAVKFNPSGTAITHSQRTGSCFPRDLFANGQAENVYILANIEGDPGLHPMRCSLHLVAPWAGRRA
jgi:hypothetical protein